MINLVPRAQDRFDQQNTRVWILGADQKDRGLWERDWAMIYNAPFPARMPEVLSKIFHKLKSLSSTEVSFVFSLGWSTGWSPERPPIFQFSPFSLSLSPFSRHFSIEGASAKKKTQTNKTNNNNNNNNKKKQIKQRTVLMYFFYNFNVFLMPNLSSSFYIFLITYKECNIPSHKVNKIKLWKKTTF